MSPRHSPNDKLDLEARASERALHVASQRQHADRVAEVALAGTVAGAAVGAVAGPAGALAGAVIGGLAGAVAAGVMDNEDERERIHTAELDDEIGVTSDNLGAASPNQPPARRGASAASAGISRGGSGVRLAVTVPSVPRPSNDQW